MADKRRTPQGSSGPRARTGPGRTGDDRSRASGGPGAAAGASTGDRARRPAGGGSTSSRGSRGSTADRRPRLTGRAAILVLVLAVLMVSYASSLRAYLQQRAHISDLSSKIAERQAAIDTLEAEKARWSDPAYLETQARARFGYVMPGETSYVVLDENGKRLDSDTTLRDPSTVIRSTPTAWWSTAWDSVELAGNPPRATKPPAAEIDGSTESKE